MYMQNSPCLPFSTYSLAELDTEKYSYAGALAL